MNIKVATNVKKRIQRIANVLLIKASSTDNLDLH